jgi:hypothetical protein
LSDTRLRSALHDYRRRMNEEVIAADDEISSQTA